MLQDRTRRLAKAAGVVALLALIGFAILSLAPATTPDGTRCGNFWGAIDVGGCDSNLVIARAMVALWLAVGGAVVAVGARIAGTIAGRRGAGAR